MANKWYPKGLQALHRGNVDWLSGTVRLALVRGYTYSDSHEFLSDVTATGGTVAMTDVLLGKTANDGVLDAADDNFGSPAAAAAIPHVIIYHDSGSPSTSHLLMFWDTATGLPVTPNGSQINYFFDNGINKVSRFS